MKKLPLFLVFLLVFVYFFHPIPLQGTNVDLGHHLLVGKWMVENGKVFDTNFLSFTNPSFKFINFEWLSEISLYLWQSWFGFNGLIVLSTILALLTFGLLFFTTYKEVGFWPTIITTLIYLQLMIDRTDIKPELFSLFFLSIFLFLLYKFRRKFTNWIWFLIPLSLSWVNFHIYFVVGEAVLLIFWLEELIQKEYSQDRKKFLTLTGVLVGSGLITLANPAGTNGVLYPLIFGHQFGYQVIENFNFFQALNGFADQTFFFFSFAVITLILGLLIYTQKRKLRLVDIFLGCFFIFLGLYAVRDFPLFALGTAVVFARVIDLSSDLFRQKYTWLTLAIFITVIPAIIWSFEIHNFGLGVIDNDLDAINFVKSQKISGPIFNNYNIGNYLEYQLYPQERVYVDGNPGEYPKRFFTDIYYPSENSLEGFNKAEQTYHFNLIFYEHKNLTQNTNQLLSQLIKDSDWKMVYLNSSLVIFVKNTPKNQPVIKSHILTEENITFSQTDLSNKDKLADLSNFFRVIGWYKEMYQMDLKYLEFDPTNCTALRHVIVVGRQENNPDLDLLLNRYNDNCTQS